MRGVDQCVDPFAVQVSDQPLGAAVLGHAVAARAVVIELHHEAATREGVKGWVRNLPDGRVEALVEGDEEAVTRVERALRAGPRSAHVDKVSVDDQEPGGYRSFTIER